MTVTKERSPEEVTQHHVENAGRVGAGVFNPRQLWTSLPDALRKLNPDLPIQRVLRIVNPGADTA